MIDSELTDIPDVISRGRGCNLCADKQQRIDALREQVERLRRFARHADDCTSCTWTDQDCICGLDAALKDPAP